MATTLNNNSKYVVTWGGREIGSLKEGSFNPISFDNGGLFQDKIKPLARYSNEVSAEMQLYRRRGNQWSFRTLDHKNTMKVTSDRLKQLGTEELRSGYKHGSIVVCSFCME